MLITSTSPHAKGSGIPEVKMILSGRQIFKPYLSLHTLGVKLAALALITGVGIPIGREGPFIHMGAIIGPCA